jgi:hypothetical protein
MLGALPTSEDAYREMQDALYFESMPYGPAEQHRDWHTLNGPGGCPWDACYPEFGDDDDPGLALDNPTGDPNPIYVACGHCHGRHTVAGVRDCSTIHAV